MGQGGAVAAGPRSATHPYRDPGCNTNEKYALRSPMIRMPVMISVRDLMMWPKTPIASPITSAAMNSPR